MLRGLANENVLLRRSARIGHVGKHLEVLVERIRREAEILVERHVRQRYLLIGAVQVVEVGSFGATSIHRVHLQEKQNTQCFKHISKAQIHTKVFNAGYLLREKNHTHYNTPELKKITSTVHLSFFSFANMCLTFIHVMCAETYV